MRLAVIATMKYGLDHFVYRELSLLAAQGISLELFPTKFQHGLYDARPEWLVHHWHPLFVVLLQPFFLLRAPLRYLALLREAFRFRAWMDFAVAWYFASQMQPCDVIYTICGDHKFFIGYFCKRILNKPLAVTIHAYELYRNPNPKLFQRALAACDQIITVTEFNRDLLCERYQVPAARVQVVRVSVDLDDYRPEKKFVVLIVAFFDERKGHEILFRALKHLDMSDVEVWVVGGNSGRIGELDVRALARDIGVESQVAFFGKLNGAALKAMYRTCDVFCLPCRTSHRGIAEGFPTVLMEAMAFGKPVITTRHVEIPRLIPEILVDENDVDGLANAIRQVYASSALRERLGAQNRALAEQYFSPRNAERTAQLLQQWWQPLLPPLATDSLTQTKMKRSDEHASSVGGLRSNF